MPGGTIGIKYSGRFVSILTSHVGVDGEAFSRACATPNVSEMVADIRAKHGKRAVVLGVDDYDVVKGVVLKLQAYGRFLATHPEWVRKVVLVQIILPTSTPDKAVVKASVDTEVQAIVDEFGPDVIHVISERSLSLAEMAAYYRASKVAVISTFWDGLNLAPYEYTASQDHDNPGTLVVSEFMGCSRSLSGVLRVNPWGLEIVSDAIHAALTLSLVR